MADRQLSGFTRDLIEAGLKLSARELARGRFIMGPAGPLWGGPRLAAADNYLADILADPEEAGDYGQFFKPALAAGPDILPWRYRPPRPEPWPSQLAGLAEDALPLALDFIGRSAALLAGAALAGAAPLDERYLYTHSLEGWPIRRTAGAAWEIGPAGLGLPRQAGTVLVLGYVRIPEIMGRHRVQAGLWPPGGWLDWPGQVAATLKLSDWLSAQGYLALPSAGGLLLAAHHGALAGLGELGRQGLLITPEYGPNLRLFTILTDYPFEPGSPVIFGVADYCETCQRCINECPAKALTEGRRRPGLFQWPVNHRACFDHWLEKKEPCRKCIEICPYTREPLVESGVKAP
ncbi:MAG: hypothetical protein LBP55_00645 [Candidatus Adiutrix sp.]|jgi:ferredoxin|nr:hypothetical protein [Candidatus Adiutrix sp.]